MARGVSAVGTGAVIQGRAAQPLPLVMEAAILATLMAHQQGQQASQIVAPGERDTSNWKWYSRWERLRQ